MATGVPVGANTAYHVTSSKPGSVSAIGGISGSATERFRPPVPSILSRPACTWVSTVGMLLNASCTRPAIKSVMPGAVPLYGTCTMSTPASDLNNSPPKCGEVPVPTDE